MKLENYHIIDSVLFDQHLLKYNRGAEIGVRHGYFSEYLLRRHSYLVMWGIDHYQAYNDIGNEITQQQQDTWKAAAATRLEDFTYVPLCMPSHVAARRLPDGFFDFVFIDACHEYESVKEDITLWLPKVRSGGLLCGHDISMAGVKKAVVDVLGWERVKCSDTTTDCWWVRV